MADAVAAAAPGQLHAAALWAASAGSFPSSGWGGGRGDYQASQTAG